MKGNRKILTRRTSGTMSFSTNTILGREFHDLDALLSEIYTNFLGSNNKNAVIINKVTCKLVTTAKVAFSSEAVVVKIASGTAAPADYGATTNMVDGPWVADSAYATEAAYKIKGRKASGAPELVEISGLEYYDHKVVQTLDFTKEFKILSRYVGRPAVTRSHDLRWYQTYHMSATHAASLRYAQIWTFDVSFIEDTSGQGFNTLD